MSYKQVWTSLYRDGRGYATIVLSAIVLSACQTPSSPQPSASTSPIITPEPIPTPVEEPLPEPGQELENAGPGGLVPPHMEGRELVRIGLLLPFSASSTALRSEAYSMLKAAEMALFETDDSRILILPKDTGGTAAGARSAAKAVIKDGAAIILGPVLSTGVAAAAIPASAANIPMIAFSTDQTVAGDGVYLLSFLPEADMQRMMDYIAARNKKIFEALPTLRPNAQTMRDKSIQTLALLRPNNRYGDRVEDAIFGQAGFAGLFVTDIARYDRDVQSMSASAREIAHGRERQAAIRVWKTEGGIGDPGLDPDFAFALPYQAIFLPESGVQLRSLAPLLPFYDVDPRITRFIGTSLWNDEELLREPALYGSWFPSPNPAARAEFLKNFEQAFDEKPGRLASLVHDGILVASQSIIAREYDEKDLLINIEALERLGGFYGADGLFRFGVDGLVQRALSVFEIRPGKIREIDPAPVQFESPELLLEEDVF